MYYSAASLLDRFTELAHDHRRTHGELLADFADPAYEAFESLHREYVRAYEDYRQRVAEWTTFRDNIDGFCRLLCLHHSLFDPRQTTTDIYWAGEELISREATRRPDSLTRKIADFKNTYFAATVAREDTARLNGRNGSSHGGVSLAQIGQSVPQVEVRPVLRDFVHTIAGYLGDRVSEVHGTSGRCSNYAIRTPSAMVRFRALKAAGDGTDSEHTEIVRRFINTAVHRISRAKVDVDQAYAWQRTKLLR